MQEKKTHQIEEELNEVGNISTFLEDNEIFIKDQNFSRYLRELIYQKGSTASRIIRNTNIEKSYFYQILNGRRKPGRDKIIMIAIALGLTKDETQKMLKIGKEGSLYAKDKRDVILQYCILKQYSIDKTQTYLENNGFDMLK